MLLKILPCPNFVAGGNNKHSIIYHFLPVNKRRLCLRYLSNTARRKSPYLQLISGRMTSGSPTLHPRLRISQIRRHLNQKPGGTPATPLLPPSRLLSQSRKKAGTVHFNSSMAEAFHHNSILQSRELHVVWLFFVIHWFINATKSKF